MSTWNYMVAFAKGLSRYETSIAVLAYIPVVSDANYRALNISFHGQLIVCIKVYEPKLHLKQRLRVLMQNTLPWDLFPWLFTPFLRPDTILNEWVHFTNALAIAIHIRWQICFVVTPCWFIRPLLNIVHATKAQLSCWGRDVVPITLSEFEWW